MPYDAGNAQARPNRLSPAISRSVAARVIQLPEEAPNPVATVVALNFKNPPITK